MSDKTVSDSGDAPQAASTTGSDAVVWVSDAMRNMEILVPFSSDKFQNDRKSAAEDMHRIIRGEPLPAGRYPKEFHVQSRYHKLDKLPDLFDAGGGVARFIAVC